MSVGRPRIRENIKKGVRRPSWSSPNQRKHQKRGMATVVAVPELEKKSKKGNGDRRGCPRNRENIKKGVRRPSWPSPNQRKYQKRGTATVEAVPESEKISKKGYGDHRGCPRIRENIKKGEWRPCWLYPFLNHGSCYKFKYPFHRNIPLQSLQFDQVPDISRKK